jgi:integrase
MTTTIDRDQYAAYLCLQNLADATIRIYTALMLRWADWAVAHDRDPWRPDPLALRAWATQLPGTASTREQARAMASHLCRALQVGDVSAAIPCPRKPRRQPRGLPDADAAKLAAAAGESGQKGLAVLTGLYTAARRSEIASLEWRRIDGTTITLRRDKTRDLHTIPLHPVLAGVLERRRVPGETWVFPGRHGGHVAPATVWQWVLDVAAAAGIGRVTPHQLRHTALTLANDRTHDLRAVQDLAGHTDPATTARYTRTSQTRLKAAVDALDYDPESKVPGSLVSIS